MKGPAGDQPFIRANPLPEEVLRSILNAIRTLWSRLHGLHAGTGS